MFKPTLNEETHPSSVDFRLQNYYIFLIYANKSEIFMEFLVFPEIPGALRLSGRILQINSQKETSYRFFDVNSPKMTKPLTVAIMRPKTTTGIIFRINERKSGE